MLMINLYTNEPGRFISNQKLVELLKVVSSDTLLTTLPDGDIAIYTADRQIALGYINVKAEQLILFERDRRPA